MHGVTPASHFLKSLHDFIKHNKKNKDCFFHVNIILETHSDVSTGQVCVKPAVGSRKPQGNTLHAVSL